MRKCVVLLLSCGVKEWCGHAFGAGEGGINEGRVVYGGQGYVRKHVEAGRMVEVSWLGKRKGRKKSGSCWKGNERKYAGLWPFWGGKVCRCRGHPTDEG